MRHGDGATEPAAPGLVLASASPRRQQLLRDAGLSFTVQPAAIDESRQPGEAPGLMVQRLARAKAAAARERQPAPVVLAADTVVALGDEIFGKPQDRADAERMMRALSGQTHSVFTGVCLRQGAREAVWVCRTAVTFRQLTGPQIARYLDEARPFDKAGAYAIQENGDLLVARYDGLYSNVVGLPIEEVLVRLREFGIRSAM